jgi:lipopolysaccharide/colanic/teichoic acid biosynthesis glycosyltransferase
MLKRVFDILFSLIGLVLLAPFFIVIALLVKLTSKGPVFYAQKRIGIAGKGFDLLKFRTMFVGSDKKGLLTVGANDSRITKVGLFLRKYKLDELPQLINVLNGTMSFVGPRPEVEKYVKMYTEKQRVILNVRPGITDFSSIYFRNESDLLSQSTDPEAFYIQRIMPQKIRLNKVYIHNQSVQLDIQIILKTLLHIFK